MAQENQNGCLIVGEGVTLSGKFSVPDVASVSGRIDGELSAREIIVGSSGVLNGKITADVMDVRGEVHQDLVSNKSLLIRSTGRVTGSISYVELEIEKGGDIHGTLIKLENKTLEVVGEAHVWQEKG